MMTPSDKARLLYTVLKDKLIKDRNRDDWDLGWNAGIHTALKNLENLISDIEGYELKVEKR